MPWEIKQGTSQCSGYGVFKEGTNELEGCHSTKEDAQRQMAALYASESSKSVSAEFEKYRGELYAKLTEEEKAFHDALIEISEKYGPFDLGTSSIWVGYESGSQNKDAQIGVMCANCSFFNPKTSGCAILSYKVEPNAKCRLAAIPDGYVVSDQSEKEFVEEMLYSMDKSKGVRVGQMVSWNSSGGRAEGKVKRIIRDGSYKVPNSDFTINGTPENPAVVIEVYRQGRATGTIVGHRMNSLTSKNISDNKEKSLWSGSFSDTSLIFMKKDYSSEERRRMASRGQAMPDGSFPIANRADLRNAIQSVGRASNYEAAKRHIIRRARSLGATDMLPEDWK
jgi:hypothetical protein